MPRENEKLRLSLQRPLNIDGTAAKDQFAREWGKAHTFRSVEPKKLYGNVSAWHEKCRQGKLSTEAGMTVIPPFVVMDRNNSNTGSDGGTERCEGAGKET